MHPVLERLRFFSCRPSWAEGAVRLVTALPHAASILGAIRSRLAMGGQAVYRIADRTQGHLEGSGSRVMFLKAPSRDVTQSPYPTMELTVLLVWVGRVPLRSLRKSPVQGMVAPGAAVLQRPILSNVHFDTHTHILTHVCTYRCAHAHSSWCSGQLDIPHTGFILLQTRGQVGPGPSPR